MAEKKITDPKNGNAGNSKNAALKKTKPVSPLNRDKPTTPAGMRPATPLKTAPARTGDASKAPTPTQKPLAVARPGGKPAVTTRPPLPGATKPSDSARTSIAPTAPKPTTAPPARPTPPPPPPPPPVELPATVTVRDSGQLDAPHLTADRVTMPFECRCGLPTEVLRGLQDTAPPSRRWLRGRRLRRLPDRRHPGRSSRSRRRH